MKSSVGVTICAVVILIGSAIGLLGAVGILAALGPMGAQLFDPSMLPPGADLRMMRAAMLSGAIFMVAFSGLGAATGIGLIRLWKWARYSAIAMTSLFMVMCVLPAVFAIAVPPPPNPTTGEALPAGARFAMAGFYLFWASIAGVFVFILTKRSTVAQFNGEGGVVQPRQRPLSVTLIAWLMIASAAMGLPMMAFTGMPAFLLGFSVTGPAAKAFYIIYLSLYALIGIGLFKRTPEAITPAIVAHAFGLVNALVLFLPSVWMRYQDVMRASGFWGADTSSEISVVARYYGAISGALFAAVVIFFLRRARQALRSAG